MDLETDVALGLVLAQSENKLALLYYKEQKREKVMAHAGFEPATFALLARRSNQLS